MEVDDDTRYDAATEVIARAMGQIAPGTPVSGTVPVAVIESRDLLDDLDQVLGVAPEPVRLADLPAMLRKIAPTSATYRSLTGIQLRELLDSEGVRTTNTGNVPRLDPVDLRHALSARSELGPARSG